MPFSPQAVANYLLDLGERDNISISPMKLQKLVYYAHGWHLGITDEPLINAQIECWKHGPVVRVLFHQFKSFGSSPIDTKATRLKAREHGDPGSGLFRSYPPSIPKSATMSREVLDAVWRSYRNFGAIKLSNMTHAPGEPWRTVFDKHGGSPPTGTDIPTEIIRDYFKDKLKEIE